MEYHLYELNIQRGKEGTRSRFVCHRTGAFLIDIFVCIKNLVVIEMKTILRM